MISDIENYFHQKPEPLKSCLWAIRQLILSQDGLVREVWRYKMPFYCLDMQEKSLRRFCYLWVDKKTQQPYVGIVDGNRIEHPDLLLEKRSRMKVLYVDPHQDLPIDKINQILQLAIQLYQKPG